jgi:SPP1 family predicted phage head-tail adaptor
MINTSIIGTTSILSERITIEKAVDSLNAKGKPVKDFQFLKESWADVYAPSGVTQYNENYIEVITSVYFTIRYDEEVNYDCQIVYDNHYYKIEFIEQIDRKRFMKITTTLVNARNY